MVVFFYIMIYFYVFILLNECLYFYVFVMFLEFFLYIINKDMLYEVIRCCGLKYLFWELFKGL